MTGFLSRIFGNGEAQEPHRERTRGPSVVTEARNQKVKEARQAGASVEALAAEFGITESSVYRITRGVRFAAPSPLNERDVEITLAYEQGTNSQELADKYGLTRERICQILRRSNVIEHRAERRTAAKETVAAEVAQIKEAAKIEFDRKVAEAVELVRSGRSISEASRDAGLSKYGAKVIGDACKKAGVRTLHGRWRDNSIKIERVRQLRAEGKNWSEVSDACCADGLGKVTHSWISWHLPDLLKKRGAKPAEMVYPATAKPPAVPRPPRPAEFDWQPESIARLLDLWFGGASAQQCADVLGPPLTRNSIIGKINRLRADGALKRGY